MLDATTGAIHLLFTRNNAIVFSTASTDHGASWSAPRQQLARLPGCTAPAGGHCWLAPSFSAIQLRRQQGRYKGLNGDLVACFDYSLLPGHTGGGPVERSGTLISSDHGESWGVGAMNITGAAAAATASGGGGVAAAAAAAAAADAADAADAARARRRGRVRDRGAAEWHGGAQRAELRQPVAADGAPQRGVVDGRRPLLLPRLLPFLAAGSGSGGRDDLRRGDPLPPPCLWLLLRLPPALPRRGSCSASPTCAARGKGGQRPAGAGEAAGWAARA